MKQILAIAPTTGHRERIFSSLRSRFQKDLWIMPLVATAFALTSASGFAANETVANTNNSGPGSLRQAITDVSAAGTVSFDPTLAGQTILLSSELTLNKALTIDASALPGGVTVSGGGAVRLIRVEAAGNLTLRGLTLTAGKGIGTANSGFGGALYNLGTALIDRCTFSGNVATEYGGGILNGQNATMTVQSSTFTVDGNLLGNSAGLYGGAIFNSSVMTVDGCTFDRNTSSFHGGAVYSDFSSTLTMTNSTFVGNTAAFYGGALFNGSPRMRMENTTLVGNHAVRIGGGVYNDFLGTPSANIQNSILTQNTAPEGGDTFGPWIGTNNITSGDPKLSPLGFFGGYTKTMPPLPDSPAIDAGAPTILQTDQRGQPRVLRTAPDIGAFELPTSDFNRTGVTIYGRVASNDQDGVFEISTDPNFLPVVTTYAGTGSDSETSGPRLSAGLSYPSGVAQDSLGNVFFADTANHRICMIGADGQVVSIAGTGEYGLANGPGPTAEFAFPSAIAVGPDDNIYVADTFNHRIAKLTRPAVAGGVWTVNNLAGNGTAGLVEGAGTVAGFNFPYGLSLDAGGNVFVADSLNHRIRKVTSAGTVSTYAGSTQGFQNSPTANLSKFDTPQGVVVVGGDLYVADSRNHRIRKVEPNGANAGAVTTFAGSSEGFSDATGIGAQFDTPSAIATDGAGSLYVADEQNHRIRKIDSLAGVTTIAGTGAIGLLNGKSDIARFHAPTGVTVTLDGNLLVADAENHVLRRVAIKPLSVPSETIVDSYGVQVKNELDVNALGLDPGVTYYFRWKSTTSGITQLIGQSFYLYDFPTVETLAATSLSPASAVLNTTVDPKNGRTVVSFEYSTDPSLRNPYEVSTLAALSNASGVVTNAAGDAFVADRLGNRILKVTPAGMVSTFAGSGAPGFTNANGTSAKFERPTGIAIDSDENLYVADEASHKIRKITPTADVTTFAGSGIAGFAEGLAADAEFLYPSGVAVDAVGNVYVADSGNQRIRKITAGVVTTLAGTGVAGSADGVTGVAQFSNPQSVAVDSGGGLLVVDTGNHKIRVISAGNVTTLAGDGSEGFLDGPGGSARFSSPRGVVEGAGGVVYVTDTGNHRIREISPDGVVSTLAGSGIAGQIDTPTIALFPATASQFNQPEGIAINSAGALLVTQDGSLRKINRSATLPTITLTPDADGTGERDLFAAVSRPLLYGTTYYYQARGTSYRDTITGGIVSFTTRRGDISVFAGAVPLTHLQADVVDFSNTPTGQPFTRQFTISNPGTWPLAISSVDLPDGFQLTGGTGVIPPLGTANFQITVTAAVAGKYSGNVVITNDAPEKTVFSFPVAGVVLDPPVLTTLDATALASGTATFNATVNPRDSSTNVWFEWSQDPNFDGVNVSTLAGEFDQPAGIITDAAGNYYIADQQNHRIRKIAADGTVSTFAGTGIAGFADGAGENAQFDQPTGLGINAAGTIFVADSNNHRIRAITSAGVVSTFSGLGTAGFTDGIATAARFDHPAGLTVDSLGRLYIADTGNNRIRVVATNGSVSTLSGTGTAGTANGAATVAEFDGPTGIARDASGYVYVTEITSHAVRRLAPDGFTSVFAGNVSSSNFFDATGAAARFSSPAGLSIGIGGVVYVADKGNNRIRRISPGGVVTTLAGTGDSAVLDGFGDVAKFFSPISLAATAGGDVIVGESGSSAVRKITPLQVLLPAATGLTGTNTLPVVLAVTGLPTSGAYYFRSIATNGGGTTIGAVLGVNQGVSTFAAWKFAKFASDAGNPLIAGPTANPSGDGISNLLKYAFGLDPLASGTDGMPVMSLSGGSLALTYTKVLGASDLIYTVEWSADLAVWSSAGITEQVVGGDSETSEILATAPGAPASAKFLRVHITLQ